MKTVAMRLVYLVLTERLNDMVEVDLHLHTTASDGRLTPSELVSMAGNRGLKVIAITDHDSTEGLAEAFLAAEQFPDLNIIPGIELSSDIPGKEIHLLGYFLDYKNKKFQQTLTEFREGRVDRAKSMVQNLEAMGLPVSWERVLELADGAVGRPHIAQAMLEKGYISTPQEAFAKYIGRNGPAYAERPKLTPVDGVKMIRGVGGIAVMAHPIEMGELSDLREILPTLRDAGLSGIEVHYGTYTQDQIQILSSIADDNGLLQCGGTDYHALGTPGEKEVGMVGPPIEIARELYKLAGLNIDSLK